MKTLSGDGYTLVLENAPHLAVSFVEARFGAGITAGTAARLLQEHGYVAPKQVSDSLSGRVLGHQSTLRNRGVLSW